MKVKAVLITTALVVAAGAGASYLVRRSYNANETVVEVVPVTSVNSSYYGSSDSGTVSGTIISKDTQVVTLDGSHELADVYVKTGDKVKKGDKLLEYDMLQDELKAEMQELTKLGLELNLKALKEDLATMKSGKMPGYDEADAAGDSADYSDYEAGDDDAEVEADDGDMAESADTMAETAVKTGAPRQTWASKLILDTARTIANDLDSGIVAEEDELSTETEEETDLVDGIVTDDMQEEDALLGVEQEDDAILADEDPDASLIDEVTDDEKATIQDAIVVGEEKMAASVPALVSDLDEDTPSLIADIVKDDNEIVEGEEEQEGQEGEKNQEGQASQEGQESNSGVPPLVTDVIEEEEKKEDEENAPSLTADIVKDEKEEKEEGGENQGNLEGQIGNSGAPALVEEENKEDEENGPSSVSDVIEDDEETKNKEDEENGPSSVSDVIEGVEKKENKEDEENGPSSVSDVIEGDEETKNEEDEENGPSSVTDVIEGDEKDQKDEEKTEGEKGDEAAEGEMRVTAAESSETVNAALDIAPEDFITFDDGSGDGVTSDVSENIDTPAPTSGESPDVSALEGDIEFENPSAAPTAEPTAPDAIPADGGGATPETAAPATPETTAETTTQSTENSGITVSADLSTNPNLNAEVANAASQTVSSEADDNEENFNGEVAVDNGSAKIVSIVPSVNSFLTNVNNITAAVDGGWDAIAGQMSAIESAMQQFQGSFADSYEFQTVNLFGETETVTGYSVSTDVISQVGESTAKVMQAAYDRLCAYHFINTMLSLNPGRVASSSLDPTWATTNESALRAAVTELASLPESVWVYNAEKGAYEFSSSFSSMNDGVFYGETIVAFLQNAAYSVNYNSVLEESADETPQYSTEGELYSPSAATTGDEDGGADSGFTAEELAEAIKEQEKNIKETELQIREAELELKEYQRVLDGRIVYAIMDGIVKNAGTVDSSSGNAFITITGKEGLYVKGTVNELSLDTVKVGDIITGTSYETGGTFPAEIVEISDFPADNNNNFYYGYGDENTNSSYYPFLAYIENADGLSVDSYVDLSLSGAKLSDTSDENAGGGSLALEEYFVRTDENGRSYCFVKGKDGLLEKRYLELGANNWGVIDIKSGLAQDDMIAFPYGDGVEEGARTKEVESLSAVDGEEY